MAPEAVSPEASRSELSKSDPFLFSCRNAQVASINQPYGVEPVRFTRMLLSLPYLHSANTPLLAYCRLPSPRSHLLFLRYYQP